jgi:hypothetical protein
MHFLRGTTGTQQGLTQVNGFVLMETQLQPSSRIAMHTHEHATIVLVLSGEYRESFHGSSTHHPPLTVITKPAGEKHANHIVLPDLTLRRREYEQSTNWRLGPRALRRAVLPALADLAGQCLWGHSAEVGHRFRQQASR